MIIRERKLPWWLIIATGVLIIAASIFVLADRNSALAVIEVIIAVGTIAFAIFNFILAAKNKYIKVMFDSHLVQGILNAVYFLLIVAIPITATLVGIVISLWLISLGIFEIIASRHYNQPKRTKLGVLLVVVGLIVLVIPLVLSFNYIILFAIVGLLFGLFRVVLGALIKKNENSNTNLR